MGEHDGRAAEDPLEHLSPRRVSGAHVLVDRQVRRQAAKHMRMVVAWACNSGQLCHATNNPGPAQLS